MLGVEGVVSAEEDEINKLNGPAWDAWLDVNWQVASDPCIHGGVEHLLVVAHKPAWREVLKRIVRRLDEAGVPYAIVGGTSLALHGLPLRVKDLDIETDVAGAYRFAALFGAYISTPVALRESAFYRSHFGQFDFDGVQVEDHGLLWSAAKGTRGWRRKSATPRSWRWTGCPSTYRGWKRKRWRTSAAADSTGRRSACRAATGSVCWRCCEGRSRRLCCENGRSYD